MEMLEQENTNNETVEESPTYAASKRILGLALLLGVAADLFFYGKAPGISWLLFVLLIVAVLWNTGRAENVRPAWKNSWLLVPLLFFAAMIAMRANPFLTTLNVLAVLAILSYVAFFYTTGRVSGLGLLATAIIPARVVGNSIVNGAPAFTAEINALAKEDKTKKRFVSVLRGGLLALPVLIIFTALLTSADLIFAGYVEDALSASYLADIAEWFWRGVLIVLTAVFLGGALLYALSRRDGDDGQSWVETAVAAIPRVISIGMIETMIVLILVNGLFLAFTAIQFVYLFGGADNIHLEGHTYAEYARRGFFELLVVVMLSLALILGLNWLTWRGNKRQIKLFNGWATLLIFFVAVIMISALQRMWLYEAAFGYTELRLYVIVFILWMVPLLIWFVLTLWKRPDLFAIGVIVTAIGFLATLNLLNSDALIAQRNITRYEQTGDLDIFYLTTLSDDAIPAMVAALPLIRGDEQPACSSVDPYGMERVVSDSCAERTMIAVLDEELNGRLQTMTNDTEWRRWQSVNTSRWNAWRTLHNQYGDVLTPSD